MAAGGSPDLHALGAFIRERRRSLGLTQTQLAERIGWAQEQISLLENGRYGIPSLPVLARIGEALEETLADVLRAAGYPEVSSPGAMAEQRPGPAGALLYTLQRILDLDTTDFRILLEQTSDLMTEAMGADKVDLFLYQPETDALVAVGVSDTPMDERQEELGLNRLPLQNGGGMVRVYVSGEERLVAHLDEDPTELPALVKDLGVRSIIEVPFEIAGSRVGVLSVSSGQPARFGEEDLRFLRIVARWVSVQARGAERSEEAAQEAAGYARQQALEESLALLSPLRGYLESIRNRALEQARESDVAHTEEALTLLDQLEGMIEHLHSQRSGGEPLGGDQAAGA